MSRKLKKNCNRTAFNSFRGESPSLSIIESANIKNYSTT